MSYNMNHSELENLTLFEFEKNCNCPSQTKNRESDYFSYLTNEDQNNFYFTVNSHDHISFSKEQNEMKNENLTKRPSFFEQDEILSPNDDSLKKIKAELNMETCSFIENEGCFDVISKNNEKELICDLNDIFQEEESPNQDQSDKKNNNDNLKVNTFNQNNDLFYVQMEEFPLKNFIQNSRKTTSNKSNCESSNSVNFNLEKIESLKKLTLEKNDQQKKYNESDLNKLFTFLQDQVFFQNTPDESQFEDLGKENILILSKLMKKIKKCNIPKELTYNQFVLLCKKKTPKRNEEKIKFIYKQALKKLYKQFEKKFIYFKNTNKPYKRIFKSKKSAFFFWLLEDTIKKETLHIDLVMDILFEKFNVRKLQKIEKKDNWFFSNQTKKKEIKKISRSIRYLIKQDSKCSLTFLKYLKCDKGQNGLLLDMKASIKQKLDKKQIAWKTELEKFDYDFEKFFDFVQKKISCNQFKTPWIVSDIKSSMMHCVKELENKREKKLKQEFDSIYRVHYSNFN